MDIQWSTVEYCFTLHAFALNYQGTEGSLSPSSVLLAACSSWSWGLWCPVSNERISQSLQWKLTLFFSCAVFNLSWNLLTKVGFRHLLKELLKIGQKLFAAMLLFGLRALALFQEQKQCCLKIIAQMALMPHTASIPLEGGVQWHLKMKWNKLKVSVRISMKMLRVNYIECPGSFPWPWELSWKVSDHCLPWQTWSFMQVQQKAKPSLSSRSQVAAGKDKSWKLGFPAYIYIN